LNHHPAGSPAQTILRYRMVFPPGDTDSFAAYTGMMRPVFALEIPAGAREKPFQAAVDTFVLDSVIVSHNRSTPLHFDRTHATILRGGLDEIMLAHYPHGGTTYFVDGTARPIAPGQIAIIDLTRTMRIESGDFAVVTLTIARRLFESRYSLPHEVHGAVLRDGLITALLSTHMRRLADPAIAIPQADAKPLAEVTMDLVIAALRQWAGRLADPASGTVSLSTLKAAIEQQIGDPDLTPARLMQQLGLSRATLYRLFEPLGGVTAYITERRLRRGIRLVTDTTTSAPRISEVARRVGFTSATTFGRAFRDMFGMTPREARALAWRPIDPNDTPWRLPKITERFVAPLDPSQHALVQRFVYGESTSHDT
jgi:AraC-like DNA-binding protein